MAGWNDWTSDQWEEATPVVTSKPLVRPPGPYPAHADVLESSAEWGQNWDSGWDSNPVPTAVTKLKRKELTSTRLRVGRKTISTSSSADASRGSVSPHQSQEAILEPELPHEPIKNTSSEFSIIFVKHEGHSSTGHPEAMQKEQQEQIFGKYGSGRITEKNHGVLPSFDSLTYENFYENTDDEAPQRRLSQEKPLDDTVRDSARETPGRNMSGSVGVIAAATEGGTKIIPFVSAPESDNSKKFEVLHETHHDWGKNVWNENLADQYGFFEKTQPAFLDVGKVDQRDVTEALLDNLPIHMEEERLRLEEIAKLEQITADKFSREEETQNLQEDQQGRTVKDPWERGQALAEARLTEEREERQRQEEADRREQVRQAELARRSERRRISEEVKLEKERISVTIEATGSGSHEDSKGDNGSDESVRGEDVFQHELYKRAQEAEKERTLVEQEAALYERQFELEYEVALLQEKCRRGTLDRIPTELYSSYGHTEPSGPRQENGQQLPVEDVPWELEQQTWGEKNAELLLMNKWDEAVDYLRADHLRVAEKLEESTENTTNGEFDLEDAIMQAIEQDLKEEHESLRLAEEARLEEERISAQNAVLGGSSIWSGVSTVDDLSNGWERAEDPSDSLDVKPSNEWPDQWTDDSTLEEAEEQKHLPSPLTSLGYPGSAATESLSFAEIPGVAQKFTPHASLSANLAAETDRMFDSATEMVNGIVGQNSSTAGELLMVLPGLSQSVQSQRSSISSLPGLSAEAAFPSDPRSSTFLHPSDQTLQKSKRNREMSISLSPLTSERSFDLEERTDFGCRDDSASDGSKEFPDSHRLPNLRHSTGSRRSCDGERRNSRSEEHSDYSDRDIGSRRGYSSRTSESDNGESRDQRSYSPSETRSSLHGDDDSRSDLSGETIGSAGTTWTMTDPSEKILRAFGVIPPSAQSSGFGAPYANHVNYSFTQPSFTAGYHPGLSTAIAPTFFPTIPYNDSSAYPQSALSANLSSFFLRKHLYPHATGTVAHKEVLSVTNLENFKTLETFGFSRSGPAIVSVVYRFPHDLSNSGPLLDDKISIFCKFMSDMAIENGSFDGSKREEALMWNLLSLLVRHGGDVKNFAISEILMSASRDPSITMSAASLSNGGSVNEAYPGEKRLTAVRRSLAAGLIPRACKAAEEQRRTPLAFMLVSLPSVVKTGNKAALSGFMRYIERTISPADPIYTACALMCGASPKLTECVKNWTTHVALTVGCGILIPSTAKTKFLLNLAETFNSCGMPIARDILYLLSKPHHRLESGIDFKLIGTDLTPKSLDSFNLSEFLDKLFMTEIYTYAANKLNPASSCRFVADVQILYLQSLVDGSASRVSMEYLLYVSKNFVQSNVKKVVQLAALFEIFLKSQSLLTGGQQDVFNELQACVETAIAQQRESIRLQHECDAQKMAEELQKIEETSQLARERARQESVTQHLVDEEATARQKREVELQQTSTTSAEYSAMQFGATLSLTDDTLKGRQEEILMANGDKQSEGTRELRSQEESGVVQLQRLPDVSDLQVEAEHLQQDMAHTQPQLLLFSQVLHDRIATQTSPDSSVEALIETGSWDSDAVDDRVEKPLSIPGVNGDGADTFPGHKPINLFNFRRKSESEEQEDHMAFFVLPKKVDLDEDSDVDSLLSSEAASYKEIAPMMPLHDTNVPVDTEVPTDAAAFCSTERAPYVDNQAVDGNGFESGWSAQSGHSMNTDTLSHSGQTLDNLTTTTRRSFDVSTSLDLVHPRRRPIDEESSYSTAPQFYVNLEDGSRKHATYSDFSPVSENSRDTSEVSQDGKVEADLGSELAEGDSVETPRFIEGSELSLVAIDPSQYYHLNFLGDAETGREQTDNVSYVADKSADSSQIAGAISEWQQHEYHYPTYYDQDSGMQIQQTPESMQNYWNGYYTYQYPQEVSAEGTGIPSNRSENFSDSQETGDNSFFPEAQMASSEPIQDWNGYGAETSLASSESVHPSPYDTSGWLQPASSSLSGHYTDSNGYQSYQQTPSQVHWTGYSPYATSNTFPQNPTTTVPSYNPYANGPELPEESDEESAPGHNHSPYVPPVPVPLQAATVALAKVEVKAKPGVFGRLTGLFKKSQSPEPGPIGSSPPMVGGVNSATAAGASGPPTTFQHNYGQNYGVFPTASASVTQNGWSNVPLSSGTQPPFTSPLMFSVPQQVSAAPSVWAPQAQNSVGFSAQASYHAGTIQPSAGAHRGYAPSGGNHQAGPSQYALSLSHPAQMPQLNAEIATGFSVPPLY